MCVTAIVASAVAGLAAASQQASVAKSSTERAYAAEEKNLALVIKRMTDYKRNPMSYMTQRFQTVFGHRTVNWGH
jgi:hypothetical protein